MQRRFVILLHEGHGPTHWDLMIEDQGTLATWQFLSDPTAAGSTQQTLGARRLPAHRIAYLNYEGPVSGNRGRVRQADAGTCEALSAGKQQWRLVFAGQKLRGRFDLREGSRGEWILEQVTS